MKIQVLGAHNIESRECKCVSLVIDNILAIDAGALTSGLSLSAQQNLKAVLLTHQHYDHIRDIPILGMNFRLHDNTINVYSIQPVYEALSTHLLNDILYPNFIENPAEKPTIQFKILRAGETESINGYTVLSVPMNHTVPTVGYQITSSDSKSVFYTADTGPGLTECWRRVSPNLLIIEVTTLSKYNDFARESGHLTPNLLQQELESFREIKGYLPRIVLVHMNPLDEKGIETEIATVAGALNTTIQLGKEGMQIEV